MTALMIGCIWHGLDALQGTRAKPGNHLVVYTLLKIIKGTLVKNVISGLP